MGKLLTHLPQLTLPQLWPTLRSTTKGTCLRDLKLSHCPNGRLTLCSLCLQGGGVFVGGGTVSIVNSQIYSNTAPNVRAHLQKFPSPRCGMFTVFALLCLQAGGVFINSGTVTLSSCTITGNTASSVRAQAQNLPSPRWETHILLVNCNNRAAVSMSRAAL